MDEHKHYDNAKISLIDARCQSNTRRLDELGDRIDNIEDLAASVKVLTTREERVERDVKEIKSDVKELTARSGKRWDGLVDKLIAALAGGFIAWILAGGSM